MPKADRDREPEIRGWDTFSPPGDLPTRQLYEISTGHHLIYGAIAALWDLLTSGSLRDPHVLAATIELALALAMAQTVPASIDERLHSLPGLMRSLPCERELRQLLDEEAREGGVGPWIVWLAGQTEAARPTEADDNAG